MNATSEEYVKILIDNNVLYDPVAHMITPDRSGGENYPLAVPASMCLRYLLKKQGELVTHQELLNHVWTARGMNVSASTLYQNISLIRKTLFRAGVQKEIVKTLPKRGFIVPADVLLYLYKNEDQVNTGLNHDSDAVHEKPQIECRGKLITFLKCYSFMIIAYIILFILLLIFPTNEEKMSFDNYNSFMDIDDCHIYRNVTIRNDDFYKNFIKSHKLQCDSRKWWYMTNYPPSERFSVIECISPINLQPGVKPKCTSSYYMH
ncbi:winged helix-turn-helix domain-containing protein [Enterobacter bugandensis]|uniref:winged helix-turn-helix domain-containing protein n=1 Tax=Enterobacter bugandensis TaxID=881260 RepID=UPI0021CE2A01|nr:winged helix-turn-helix domain-containing protein [Enterobacter bugandensis]MCU6172066.1 winged helix-turn-helix domain-containing protein [Enterobacter bugandensis]MCU6190263.1 winged helix-turn-helix domain-containing protein [Enterobacter bugandensis]